MVAEVLERHKARPLPVSARRRWKLAMARAQRGGPFCLVYVICGTFVPPRQWRSESTVRVALESGARSWLNATTVRGRLKVEWMVTKQLTIAFFDTFAPELLVQAILHRIF